MRHWEIRVLRDGRGVAVVGIGTSVLFYVPRPDRTVELSKRILTLTQRQKRYGIGMICLELRQVEWAVNRKRAEHLCLHVESLVRLHKRKKALLGELQSLFPREEINRVWSMQFIFDRTGDGPVLNALTIFDEP